MGKTVPELMAAISPEDWAQVPTSVLKLIEELVRRMDKLEQEMAELRTENQLVVGFPNWVNLSESFCLPGLLSSLNRMVQVFLV